MSRLHKALYDYLLEKGDTWTSQVQVARDLFGEFGNGEAFLEPSSYHNTTERRTLTMVIREINESADFEKIIVSGKKGIKIANEKEFDQYIMSRYKSAIRKLSGVYKMAKKGNRNGQIDFGGHTVEAFLERCDNGN